MKNLYKFLLALLMVAASVAGNKAKAQNQSYFEYSTNCLKVSLWATDKRAFDSCAQVKFTLNGTYVTGPQATYTFTTAGTYTVCMKILNSCKKWDTSICKSVTVTDCKKCNWKALNPYFSVWDSCKTLYGYFSPANGCYKYSWKINGVVVSHDRYLKNYAITKNGTYDICINVQDTCNKCDTTFCGSRTITCFKSACDWSKAAWSYSVNCRKLTFEGNNLLGACYKYSWAINGTVINARVGYYNFPNDGVYKVCMKVYDSCHQCDTVICKEITIKCANECEIKAEFGFSNDCLKAKFIAGSNVSGATYYWSFGDGYAGGGKEIKHNYLKTGVYKVCLTVIWKDPNTGKECKTLVCREIKISCGNDCNIKGDFKFATNGNMVKFSASSNNGLYYSWNFGDGTTGSGQNPVHYYKKPGTYEVCVTIYDKTKKCSVKICKKVVIEDQCNVRAYFTWKASGNTISFDGIAYNGDYYVWSFGDGTYGTGRDPKHTYSKPGTYKVCLTVYSKSRKCKTTVCKEIVIKGTDKCNWAKLGVDFYYSLQCPKLILEGKNLNSNGSGCYTYGWSVTPAGTNQSTTFYGRVQTITFSSNGVFNVCMKVYDSCHKCDTVICKTITVNCNKKCVLPTGWSQKAGVNCGNFVFDGYKVVDNNGNIVINPCHKYYWSFGDGTYGHGKTVEHKYGKNGTYKICMKVVDTCLNCDTIICNEVKVDCYKDCNWKAKYPNFTTFSIGAKCRTISAGLNTSSAGCIRQYYSIAGGAYSYDGKTYRDFTVDKNGTYVVCLKLVDTCTGCDTTICKEVKVECNPCSWTGNGFYYKVDCNKVYLEGKVTNNTCVKYVFYTGNSFIGGGRLQSYTFTKNGSYDICMKLYDTCKNCDTVICQTVKIDCQPCKAQAKFTVDSTTSGGVAYITNYSTGGAYYFWDFGDSTFSYSKNPGKHAYSASGGYTICLTVYDSAKTCSTKYCVTIKVVKTRAASISESNKLPEIKLYPNPADAYFTISVTGTGTYEVVNLQGKSISSGILNNETRVNTAGWSEGVYLVRSTLADGHVTTRMVITRQ